MKVMTQVGLALSTLMSSGAVLAHPGSHSDLTSWDQVMHYLSSPYHLTLLLVLGTVINGIMIWQYCRGR
jgi:hypothetical protein